MNGREPPQDKDPVAELRALARDWITLWQSELAAAAMDREAQESWQALLALWAGAAASLLKAMPRHDGAGPAAAPRPAPAAAAPDPRDAEIERLGRRIAELEQRLAVLERTDRGTGPRNRRRAGGE